MSRISKGKRPTQRELAAFHFLDVDVGGRALGAPFHRLVCAITDFFANDFNFDDSVKIFACREKREAQNRLVTIRDIGDAEYFFGFVDQRNVSLL